MWINPNAEGKLEAIGVHATYDNVAVNIAISLWKNGTDIPKFVSALDRVEQVTITREHAPSAAALPKTSAKGRTS